MSATTRGNTISELLSPPLIDLRQSCELLQTLTMDDVPITGLEELERHLQHVVEAPETPLDAKLFDEVELQLTGMSPPFSTSARLTRARLQYSSSDPTITAEPLPNLVDIWARPRHSCEPRYQAPPTHPIHSGAHLGL